MPRATLKAFATWAATRQSGLPESEDDFYSRAGLVQAMEVGPKDLSACGKALPRLTGKPWWLIKEVQVFPPDEMRDLEFEPVIPILAGKLGTPEGQAAASAMTQYRGRAIPALLAALKSSDPNERRRAAFACGISYTRDPRLVAYIPDLLQDGDARTRAYGCNVARLNWDKAIVPRLQELLGDENQAVGSAAYKCLQEHLDASQLPVYRKLAEDDGPAALPAVSLVGTNFTRDQLLHLLGSTNHEVVISAFSQLRSGDLSLQEVETVLTNTLPVVRALGIGALTRLGDKSSVDRLVAMLRDPDEFVRWRVRSSLRYLSGLKLGPDPAAWEKWWTENKQDYTPTPRPGPRSGIR